MLKVWGRRSSSNVQAVMWCIAELDIAHERIDAGHTFGVVDTAGYLAMNPNGTVPTIVDGDGAPIWETGAILRYLASRYGSQGFWPGDPAARAQVDKWAEWAKVNIATRFTVPIFWQIVRTPAAERDLDGVRRGLQTLDRFLAIADSRLAEGAWIAGDALTLADIQFGHCLYRYHDIDIDRTEHPNLERYYARLTDRPAFREHVMVSYDELRA